MGWLSKALGSIVKVAVVAAAVATGVGAIAGLTAGASFLGLTGATAYFAQSFVINAVLGIVSSALSPKPSDLTSAADLRGQTIMSRNSIASRKLVYGRIKTSGTIVFLETTNDNKDLHTCVTLASHEINAVESVYLNDTVIYSSLADGIEYESNTTTDPDYRGNAFVTAHFGTDTQTADGNLVSRTSMTVNHRLQGIAYLYTKLVYDQDKFANGQPNVAAIVQGRKVYDPRTATTAYSNNAALCILDYIRDERFGLGASDDEIDFDSFSTAADICDESVSLVGGGTEKRYTINGVMDTSKQPAAILQDMVGAMAGTIYYSNGQWKVRAGAYVTPVHTLSMDDVIGNISIKTRVTNQANFNAVKGIFMSPEDNWQPTDYPSVVSSVFTAEDNGEQKFVDVTLPFTTSPSTAQRLAKISLYRNREQVTLSVPCNLKAFKYEVGDTLYFTNERMGFDAKVFEVIGWEMAQSESNGGVVLGVNLMLKETSAAVYSWSTVDETEMTRNNTTLPPATFVTSPGITVSDELRSYNEEVITTLVVSVTSTSPFADRFEVEAQKSGDTDWINLGQASGNRFELPQVLDGATYNVRARAISRIGVRSSWTTASHQVVGKTAPPSDVTGLTGNLIGNQYLLTWDAVPDLDLSHYRVRFAAEDGSPTYQNAITLVPKVSRPATSVLVPARNGTYFVRAVDKLGLVSENAVSVVLDSNIADIELMNVVQTVNEHPDFNGTFDDVVEIDEDDRLVLNTSLSFDAVLGNFDDAEGQFDGGAGNIDAEGFYYFANNVDLGAVYTSRVTATIKSIRVDYVGLFDSASGLFDDRLGAFDGDVDAFDDVDAEMQVRYTEGDPTGTPTWSAWKPFQVSDIRAWGLEFRCRMTTLDDQATPAVSHLSVTVDMPDRVVAQQDLTTGASSYSVTFPDGAFRAIPAIGIGAQDLQSGDYYEITSKTTAGFAITFKNSSGVAVSRTFDYTAKSWGRVIT